VEGKFVSILARLFSTRGAGNVPVELSTNYRPHHEGVIGESIMRKHLIVLVVSAVLATFNINQEASAQPASASPAKVCKKDKNGKCVTKTKKLTRQARQRRAAQAVVNAVAGANKKAAGANKTATAVVRDMKSLKAQVSTLRRLMRRKGLHRKAQAVGRYAINCGQMDEKHQVACLKLVINGSQTHGDMVEKGGEVVSTSLCNWAATVQVPGEAATSQFNCPKLVEYGGKRKFTGITVDRPDGSKVSVVKASHEGGKLYAENQAIANAKSAQQIAVAAKEAAELKARTTEEKRVRDNEALLAKFEAIAEKSITEDDLIVGWGGTLGGMAAGTGLGVYGGALFANAIGQGALEYSDGTIKDWRGEPAGMILGGLVGFFSGWLIGHFAIDKSLALSEAKRKRERKLERFEAKINALNRPAFRGYQRQQRW